MDQGQARSQHVHSQEIARGLNGYEKGGRNSNLQVVLQRSFSRPAQSPGSRGRIPQRFS